ncbi:MAG: GlsB/YeaQ/YmgE family stress response membrane protein [Bacteroidota bacterium]
MLYGALVGILAGWLSGQIMKGRGHGLIGNLILGLIGGMFGSWMIGKLGFFAGSGIIPSVMTATFGAVALIWLARLITGKSN